MAFKALCLAFAIVCSVTAAPEGRIVGGTPTTIEQFPYILALTYRYPGAGITVQRCVGALISSYHALTTAYCFTGSIIANFEVRAGSTTSMFGGTVVTIDKVIKHPDYQESPRTADVSVVHLATPLAITDVINILYLPPQGTYIPDGSSVKVVSWGFESMQGPQLETLKTINLRKVPLTDCVTAYAGKNVVIGDPVICAMEEGPIGTCLGDSGAPMAINNVVVGLSSYFEECATDIYPDVFTRIDRYTNWIISVATPPSKVGSNMTGVRVKSVEY